jgi:O-antigen/teichoic acid export membrane protein
VLVNVLRARDRFGLALLFGEHVRRVVLVGSLLVAASGAASAVSARTALAWTATIESGVYLVALLVLVRLLGRTGRHAVGRAPEDGPSTGTPPPSPVWLLRSGGSFAVATLASVTVPQAGVWLLAVVAPVEEVAEFSVAVRIAVLVAVPTAIGMRTLAPRIAAAAGSGRLASLQEPVRRFAVWSTVATALAVAVLAAAGHVLLPAGFGEEYGAALAPALVMCAGVLVNAWTGPCSVVLSHAGQQRVVAVSALVSALTFAGLAIWWGAVWGGTGVAAAAAVAMAGRNVLLARAARQTLGIRTVALPNPRGK